MENVYVSGTIGDCKNYMQGGKRETVSICLIPLKVTEKSIDNGTESKFKSGCSMWKTCENLKCDLSQVAYGGPKKDK